MQCQIMMHGGPSCHFRRANPLTERGCFYAKMMHVQLVRLVLLSPNVARVNAHAEAHHSDVQFVENNNNFLRFPARLWQRDRDKDVSEVTTKAKIDTKLF